MVALIVGATIISCSTPNSPGTIEGYGRTTFESLGWDEDRVLTAESSPAEVRFYLPEGATQGDELWYGLRLIFEWRGSPGEFGDYAFLNGLWNERAIYQFMAKRTSSLDSGFRWSMADMVNGNSQGYELGEVIRVDSTNMAKHKAVSSGVNELTFSLGLRDASNKEVTATVSRDSEIIATTWRPTLIDGLAKAHVEGNVVDVDFRGKNLGWGARSLNAKVQVWSGIYYDEQEWDLGALAPLGDLVFERQITLQESRVPHRVEVELDWGAGRQHYIAWDPASVSQGLEIPYLSGGIFRNVVGFMVAVAALWVAVPALVSSIRKRRGR